MARLSHLFPGQSVIGYASLLWGAWAGRVLGIVYALYFIVLVGLVLRTFADLTIVFLPPVPVTVVAMLGVTAYAGQLRINAFAFLSDLLAWLTLIPVVLLILAGLTRFQPELLQPALSGGWSGVLTGMRAGIFSWIKGWRPTGLPRGNG